jgi:hypothetical protein
MNTNRKKYVKMKTDINNDNRTDIYMEMDTDMNAEIEIDFGIDMYMDGGRGFNYKNLKSSHLWRAAYTPG